MIRKDMQKLGESRSAIRELFEYGKRRAAEVGAENVFDFSLGNPSVPPPEATQAALRAMVGWDPVKLHGYTSAPGDAGVREALAHYLDGRYSCSITADCLYLTAGASAALTATLHAVAGPGEEVLVISPYFPEYRVFIEKTGAVMREVPATEGTFMPDCRAIAEAVTERCAAIIVNSPNNPTGAVYPREVLEELGKMLTEKGREIGHKIYLIADEPYRELVYDGVEVPLLPDLYPETVVCYSFSKSLSLPGERIGYVLVPPTVTDAPALRAAVAGAARTLGFVCAPSMMQFLLPSLLGQTSDLSVYEENRRLLTEALTEMGYRLAPSKGAFYLFMQAPGGDAGAFAKRAMKYDLLLVPSDSFGCPGYVRLAYCQMTDKIRRSLPAFRALAESYGLKK